MNMNFSKFLLKDDWYRDTELLGFKSRELIFPKGHIFESDSKGLYNLIWGGWSEENTNLGGRMQLTEKMMREAQDGANSMFEEIPVEVKEEVIMTVEELQEDEDVVKSWRIQLDVKTTRSKLREVERIINDMVKPILEA